MKAKSRPFEGARAGGGGGFDCTGGLVGTLSKKLPPLRGGGEEICGATGGDFRGGGLLKPLMPEKADCPDCDGGDFTEFEAGKLSPLKASFRPPREFRWAGGDDRPPNEGCRLWGGGSVAGCGFGAEA